MSSNARLAAIIRGEDLTTRTLLQAAVKQAVARLLPKVTGAQNGKALLVESGAWKAGDLPDYAPFAVTGTPGTNDQEKATLTLNKTAAELYTAAGNGRAVKMTAAVGEDHANETVFGLTAVRDDNDGAVTYAFYAVGYDGKRYAGTGIAGTAAVVLTEV